MSRTKQQPATEPDGQRDGEQTPTPTTESNGTVPKVAESKADKFRRLYKRRLPKMVKAMVALRNLANTRQYERSEAAQVYILSQAKMSYDALVAAYSGESVAASPELMPD